MATSCPRCNAPAQPDSRFCDECGTPLVAEAAAGAPARPSENLPPLPPLPSLPNLKPLSLEPGQLGSELIVEVETNRPMVHGHALMLRFRVTSNLRTPCGVILRMKLYGQGPTRRAGRRRSRTALPASPARRSACLQLPIPQPEAGIHRGPGTACGSDPAG